MKSTDLIKFILTVFLLQLASSAWAQSTYLLSWGSVGPGPGELDKPTDVAIDGAGNVYVTDSLNHRVQKFDASGNFILQWGTQGSGDGQFDVVRGIAIDVNDNIYVTDGNNRIQKFDIHGNFVAKFGSFANLRGIDVDSNGNVYIVDSSISVIQKWSPSGVFLDAFAGIGSGFGPAIDLAIGPNGNVYITDGNDRVQVFDSNGDFSFSWGTEGIGDGQFRDPNGIAIDDAGNVFVSDTGWMAERVQMFDANGNFLLKWGGPGSTIGFFDRPSGIAVDAVGNVYVADEFNDRIQKFGESTVATESPLRGDLLLSAWPNPFNPQTMVSFSLDSPQHVRLSIHDARGRHVVTLLDKIQMPGRHEIRWDGRDRQGQSLASGVYRYSVEAGGATATRSVVLLK